MIMFVFISLVFSLVSTHLVQQLRAEQLQAFNVPLSSDAFSMWGFDGRDVHNAEVLACSQHLVDVNILFREKQCHSHYYYYF